METEKKEKLGSEPAFPVKEFGETVGTLVDYKGMSKRLYLAGMMMQGILTNPYLTLKDNGKLVKELTPKLVAETAYNYVDELLKQENL
jgi:hypothetical protein